MQGIIEGLQAQWLPIQQFALRAQKLFDIRCVFEPAYIS